MDRVSKGLCPSLIRQTRPIPHGVIKEVVGFIDVRRTGRELMEDVGHLRRGIIRVRRLRAVGQGHRRAAAQAVVGEGVRPSGIDACQSVPVLVVGVRQRHARLIRGTGGAGREQPIGLVVGHRERAIRISHREQIPHGIIRVTVDWPPYRPWCWSGPGHRCC